MIVSRDRADEAGLPRARSRSRGGAPHSRGRRRPRPPPGRSTARSGLPRSATTRPVLCREPGGEGAAAQDPSRVLRTPRPSCTRLVWQKPAAFDILSHTSVSINPLWPSGNLKPIEIAKISRVERDQPLAQARQAETGRSELLLRAGRRGLSQAVSRPRTHRPVEERRGNSTRAEGAGRSVGGREDRSARGAGASLLHRRAWLRSISIPSATTRTSFESGRRTCPGRSSSTRSGANVSPS